MQDHTTPDHGFVSPWFTNDEKLPTEEDYFPNDYPIAETLVPSADQNAAVRNALDSVGAALQQQDIDFYTAAELSDMIKAGHIEEAVKRLEFDPADN